MLTGKIKGIVSLFLINTQTEGYVLYLITCFKLKRKKKQSYTFNYLGWHQARVHKGVMMNQWDFSL